MKLQRLKSALQRIPSLLKTPQQVAPDTRLRGRAGMARLDRLRARNPLCVHCQALGLLRLADQYDHVVPLWKGGPDTEANMQGLCKECHDVKSAAEAGERAALARSALID